MFSQTRARAASSVAASTFSFFMSCSARSRLSDISDLHLDLTLHFNLKPMPDPVKPDGHVVLLDLEHSSELFDRQPLDVTQQEQRSVLVVEDTEGTSKPLLEQQRWLNGGVRRLGGVIRLGTKLTAAQHVDGRIDGGAPEVRARQRNILDVSTPGQNTNEDGLQDVLGVGRISGDAQGRAEYRLVMALVQLGKPRHWGGGRHRDRQVVDLCAGCGHLVRLTNLDARGGRLLHGVAKNCSARNSCARNVSWCRHSVAEFGQSLVERVRPRGEP